MHPEEPMGIVDGVTVQGCVPTTPDPLWPIGAEPTHLSVADKQNKKIVDKYTGNLCSWACEKCGKTFPKSSDPRYCATCFKDEKANNVVAKRINANWIEDAGKMGLALYERQPEETDSEWRIWELYRRHYPLKMPNWTELAIEAQCTAATVVRAANKWSFRVRLQAWARFTDDTMLEERVAAIQEMNTKQLTMAQKIQGKLEAAIDMLDPELLKPNEIVNLFKVATELERRVVTALPEKVEGTVIDTGQKTEQLTRTEDLGEVVGILARAGVLNIPGKAVGVEQTTRILVREENP